MNETAETKICPFCAETVKAAAKKCPHCRSTLKNSGPWYSGILRPVIILALLYAPLMLGAWWFGGLNRPGRNFDSYREKLVISDSAIHYGHIGNTNTVSTIGFLRNDSPFAWKTLQLEVQYYDKSGKLVDTATDTLAY